MSPRTLYNCTPTGNFSAAASAGAAFCALPPQDTINAAATTIKSDEIFFIVINF
jgi:hypothetical protein